MGTDRIDRLLRYAIRRSYGRRGRRDRLVREAYERTVRAAEREIARSAPAGLALVPEHDAG